MQGATFSSIRSCLAALGLCKHLEKVGSHPFFALITYLGECKTLKYVFLREHYWLIACVCACVQDSFTTDFQQSHEFCLKAQQRISERSTIRTAFIRKLHRNNQVRYVYVRTPILTTPGLTTDSKWWIIGQTSQPVSAEWLKWQHLYRKVLCFFRFVQCGVKACGTGHERRCREPDEQSARHHAIQSDHFTHQAGKLLGMDVQVGNPCELISSLRCVHVVERTEQYRCRV